MKGSDTNYINNRIMVGGMKNNVSAMGWLVITTTSTGCNYYFNALKTASDTQKIALNYNTNGYTYYWRAIKFYT